MTIATTTGTHPHAVFELGHPALFRPFVWISRGWDDLVHTPRASLTYGLLVSVFGALILSFWRHPYLIAASISGFLLVGPLLTTGLCELSRLRERGQPTTFDDSLSALGRHRSALTRFAGELLMISAAWFGVSTLLISLAFGDVGPNLHATIWGGALEQITAVQALSYLAIGGILAAIVFARSVVSVPLIIDQDADAAAATATSLRVTFARPLTMALWAVLIVALVAVGFATLLLGMVVIFPLLGHATWHAYRDLVHAPQ
jgi:uncharacterized membrane protein